MVCVCISICRQPHSERQHPTEECKHPNAPPPCTRADPQTRYEKPPSSRVSQDSGHFTSRRTRRGLQGKKKTPVRFSSAYGPTQTRLRLAGSPAGRSVGRIIFFLLLCLLTLINEPSHCRTSLLRTNCPVYCGTRGCKTNGPEPAFFAGAGR